MEGYTWSQILLFFFIYCFLGWILESAYVSVMERKLTNRGFLRGPVIPIYGFGAMMIVFATTPFRGNYLAEFISGLFAATLFEYVVGITMEAIFKIKYWDYSHKPFQYKGYICLESSLCWGVLSVFAAEVLQVQIENMVFLVPESIAMLLASIFVVLFCIDTIRSIQDAWSVRKIVVTLEKLKTNIEQLQQDVETRSEEFVQLLEERINAKKAELEQLKTERTDELYKEIAQLRKAIEREKQERELAQAQFSARIERDILALQLKLEQEKDSLYEKLQQIKVEYEERKITMLTKSNLLLQSLKANEGKLEELFQKKGNILKRNPGAVSSKLGNLRYHLERQAKRKKVQESNQVQEEDIKA